MKKTRVLALLLCVMMVITILPVWQASATTTTYDSMEEAAQKRLTLFKQFDFSTDTYTGDSNYIVSGVSFSSDEGLGLNGGQWRYAPSDGWSALAQGRVVYFQAAAEAEGTIDVYIIDPDTTNQRYGITIASSGISGSGTINSESGFIPGTDLVNYLVVNNNGGYLLYAQHETKTENKWVLVLSVSGYYGSTSSKSGLYFNGQGSVKTAAIYAEDQSETYETIDQIMGKTMNAEKTFDMTNKDYQSESGFVFKPQGDHTAENGATIYSTDGGNGFWRYNSGTASWSPLTVGTRAAYFQAKVTDGQKTEILVQSPAGGTEYGSFQISPTEFGENNFSQLDYARTGGAGTDFVEYLLVAETNTKINLYAKGLTNDGKWVLAATASGFAKNDNANMGLYFAGDCYLKKVILYNNTGSAGGGDNPGGGTTPDVGGPYDSIDQIVGKTMYVQKEYDLTQSIVGQDSNLLQGLGAETFDAENGMTLNGGYARLIQALGWSPIADGRVAYFKAKVADEAQMLSVLWAGPAGSPARTSVAITASGIAAGEGGITQNSGIAPGTDWVEYLVVAESDEVWSLYVKNSATSNKWMLAAQGGYGTNGGDKTGLYFSGQGHILSAIIYHDTEPEGGGETPGPGEGGDTPTPPPVNPPSTESYRSITDVVGRNLVADVQFNMREDNFTLGGTSYLLAGDLTYDSGNGMALNGGYWRYVPASYYKPVTTGDKVVFFRAKVKDASSALGVLWQGPEGGAARAYANIKSNSISVAEGGMHYGKTSFVAGTDWTDYLIVADTDQVWTMYANNASTGYQWTAILKGGYGTNGGASTGLYFTGQGYVKEAAIYKNGTAAGVGVAITPEELFGVDILEADKKLTFDANFDGATENAGAKNVVTNADLTPYTIGENGLELKNTGVNEYFAWNYGTTNKWNPLGTRTPVTFRAKMSEGGELGIKVGGGEYANILLTPTGARVDGVLGMDSNYAIGTDWVNYILVTDGAIVKLYARGDNETNWTLIATPERYAVGGYYGILLSNTKSATTYVSEIQQGKFFRATLTDKEEIAELYGKLYMNEANPDGTYDMTGIDPRGVWYVRVKATVTGSEGVSGTIRNNGKELSWSLSQTALSVGPEAAMVSRAYGSDMNTQHEILFAYNFNRTVNVYLYNGSDGTWTKTHADVATGTLTGVDDISFAASAGNVDSVQIYSGDLFVMESVGMENETINLAGEYLSGTLDTPLKRRGVIVTATYDKEHGYTTFAEAKTFEAEGGIVLPIAESIAATGIDAATNNVAVMVWDTLSGGIPLAEGVGVMARNNATGKPENNQVPGLSTSERFNGVRITGYAGGADIPVVATLVDADDILRGAIQTKANADGMVDVEVAVDPNLPNGTYTLMVQYGSTTAITRQVNLYGENIPYNSITSVSDMNNFLAQYGGVEVKNLNREDGFAADVLERFNEIKDDVTTFNDIYDFRDVMDAAIEDEVRERTLCKRVNNAARDENWSEIKMLLLETYASDLGLSEADIAGIQSVKNLFLRMTGGYHSDTEIVAAFRSAVVAQKQAEAVGGGIGGGTGGAGGGAGGGGFVGPNTAGGNAFSNVEVDSSMVGGGSVPMVEGSKEFNDLESVPWAKESIIKLQTMQIVSGDGDGGFHPDRAVTREEFLKMAMQAADIQVNAKATLTFNDVNAGEWYYPYVAAAFEAGIIQGQSEEYFGIGQQITRSDMAVILKRILDYKGIILTEIKAAFVFDDFDTIPNYARESIALLSEAGLMNGVGDNTFQGAASATRAESAVAILRVYNYIAERR